MRNIYLPLILVFSLLAVLIIDFMWYVTAMQYGNGRINDY